MAIEARLDYVDTDLAQRVVSQLKSMIADSRQLLTSEPEKLRQRRLSFLSRELRMLANYLYALGEPLTEVNSHLRDAAVAKLRVFELRGQGEGFERELVTITLDHTRDDVNSVERQTDRADGSLTNSRSGLDAIYMAMVSGQFLMAQRLAQLIGDPSDAPWVGADSDVCTWDDQRIAYAVRDYILGESGDPEAELGNLSNTDSRSAAEGSLVRALIEEPPKFAEALEAQMKWHRTEARKKRNRKNTDYFLNLTALGLTALAIRNLGVAVADLPQDAHSPLELLVDDYLA